MGEFTNKKKKRANRKVPREKKKVSAFAASIVSSMAMTRKSVHSDVNPWLLLLLLLFLLLFFHLPLPHSLSPFFFFLIKPFSCGGEEETVAASVLLFCRLSLSFTDVSLSCTCVYSQLLRRFFFFCTLITLSPSCSFSLTFTVSLLGVCVCVCAHCRSSMGCKDRTATSLSTAHRAPTPHRAA